MPLNQTLLDVEMTFNCPHCDHAVVKRGGWFQTVPRFTCKGCQRKVLMGYPDRVALFEKHSRPI